MPGYNTAPPDLSAEETYTDYTTYLLYTDSSSGCQAAGQLHRIYPQRKHALTLDQASARCCQRMRNMVSSPGCTMATTEPPDLYTDISSGLRRTIADQCNLLGALTTYPRVLHSIPLLRRCVTHHGQQQRLAVLVVPSHLRSREHGYV